jgi:hypothetical protein
MIFLGFLVSDKNEKASVENKVRIVSFKLCGVFLFKMTMIDKCSLDTIINQFSGYF